MVFGMSIQEEVAQDQNYSATIPVGMQSRMFAIAIVPMITWICYVQLASVHIKIIALVAPFCTTLA